MNDSRIKTISNLFEIKRLEVYRIMRSKSIVRKNRTFENVSTRRLIMTNRHIRY